MLVALHPAADIVGGEIGWTDGRSEGRPKRSYMPHAHQHS